ncbi:cob(I)yrinic acid a,c-diamide adenosyltransferase [Flexithrix dorotheae]|uniref:cob(I)yrinic acid a,c-diamide adenosyltransferase n=1 Tax=Flexithrix dorotheae TaxID=70993 RepID=UPI000379612E|nr:cob(I)yrinic acid a,c-diamide adenosyltransferase [Flexithrix dorotheae]
MKIYTKTGDKGQTSLLGGNRVSKTHARIEAYGTIDELNVQVGHLRDFEVNKQRQENIIQIQNTLFTTGSILAAGAEASKFKLPELSESDIIFLEKEMDHMDDLLPPMKNFVLPGGHLAVSAAHQARVVCRRAERLCIHLSEKEEVPELIIKYLNRLSDYFFVLSRMITKELKVEEIPWKPDKK